MEETVLPHSSKGCSSFAHSAAPAVTRAFGAGRLRGLQRTFEPVGLELDARSWRRQIARPSATRVWAHSPAGPGRARVGCRAGGAIGNAAHNARSRQYPFEPTRGER